MKSETNIQYLRRRLLEKACIFDRVPLVSLSELEKTEWCKEFEVLMRNRLLLGALRYGRMRNKEKGNYSCIRYIINKLEMYCETGNTECLVDVANLALVEFVHSRHPNKHFAAQDDTTHAEVI